MKIDIVGLSELALWNQWQEVVRLSLPNFCADRVYVDQLSPTQEEFEEVLCQVVHDHPVDVNGGAVRDKEFGGIVRVTPYGSVTRMWLDANIEINFLRRRLGLHHIRALDIGAGYGRLAVPMRDLVDAYYYVDPVPISTELCRKYTTRFNHGIVTLSLEDFVRRADTLDIDLAINVHSWNECNLSQISRWLDVLREMMVPWLFTVSHPDSQAYLSYDLKSWKDLLLKEYDLVAEEFIGLGKCPHVLWRRR